MLSCLLVLAVQTSRRYPRISKLCEDNVAQWQTVVERTRSATTRCMSTALREPQENFTWNKPTGNFFKEILRRCRADCMRLGIFWVVNEAMIDFDSRMLWRIQQISGLFTSACSLSGSLSEICRILHIRLSLSQWYLNPGCKIKYGSEKKCCRTIRRKLLFSREELLLVWSWISGWVKNVGEPTVFVHL